jgi:hypothetical protein
MRPDSFAGAVFPDYELNDHTAKHIDQERRCCPCGRRSHRRHIDGRAQASVCCALRYETPRPIKPPATLASGPIATEQLSPSARECVQIS